MKLSVFSVNNQLQFQIPIVLLAFLIYSGGRDITSVLEGGTKSEMLRNPSLRQQTEFSPLKYQYENNIAALISIVASRMHSEYIIITIHDV